MALRVEVPGDPNMLSLGHLFAKISSTTPHYWQNYEICPNIFFSVKDPFKDSVPAASTVLWISYIIKFYLCVYHISY